MAHPTPAQIKDAIFKALDEDYKANPYSNRDVVAPIPVRTYKLINDAISKACDEVKA